MANRCYAFFAQCLRFPAWEQPLSPAWGRLRFPAWEHLQSLPGTLASTLPGYACQFPAWGRLPVPAWDACWCPAWARLPIPCLGTFCQFFFFFFAHILKPDMPRTHCALYVYFSKECDARSKANARAIESDSAAGRSCMRRQAGEQKEMRGKKLRENASQERKGVGGGLSFVASLTRPSKIEGCWCGACVVHASCMWCMRSRRQDVGVACMHDA